MKLYTPFSTRLSGSAKETEIRLRSIFRWKKKRPPMVLIVLVLAIALSCGGLVACREESSASAASPGFGDIGKTLSELKDEHPEGEFVVCLDAFPESAAICFGEPEAEYSWCFFGTQSGDAEKAMNELKDRLNCAGLVTTVSVLFPEMEDKMSFEEFFSFIGVENYEYFGEEAIAAEGWLRFSYQGMEVMVNTNEPAAGGGWNVTGAEIVKCDAPASIVDPEIFLANAELADSIMFQEESYHLIDLEVSLWRDGYPVPVGPGSEISFFQDANDGAPRVEVLEGWEPIYWPGAYWSRQKWDQFTALCYHFGEEPGKTDPDAYSVYMIDTSRTDLKTYRGIRVGSTRAEVLETYPNLYDTSYWHDTDPDFPGEDYLWYCKNEEGFGAALLFFFDGDTVSQIRLNNMFN